MDRLLEQLETEITSLVDKISHYRPIEDCSKRILQLDRDAVAALEELRQHYDACKRLEHLKLESLQLDKKINETLVGLSECRKLLETTSVLDEASEPIAADVLLNYATKITRFTKKSPGIEVLPWPTEDQIRKGMLATLALQRQEQAEAQHQMDTEIEPAPESAVASATQSSAQSAASSEAPPQKAEVPEQAPKPRNPAPKPLINLDLDSDSD